MSRTLTARKLAPLAATTLFLCVSAVASAATLNGATGDDLSVGATAVLDCDPDGVTVSHVTSGSTLTDLSISGIDAACIGGELSVTLADAGGASVATAGPVTIAGATEAVSVSPTLDAGTFTQHHVRIIGP